MSSTRTDLHRPSQIVPDDYDFVSFNYYGSMDLGAVFALREQGEILREHMARTGGKFDKVGGGICDCCGNQRVRYVSYFYHEKSNSYIRLGWQCAQKLELAQDGADANMFKVSIKAAIEHAAGKQKAQALLTERNLTDAWTLYTSTPPENERNYPYNDLWTLRDIVGKLVKYGDLSDKQWTFLGTLADRLGRWREVAAEREAEREAAAPAPEGRHTFTAEVLTVKWQESYVGPDQQKMLLRHADGWKVWLTVPRAIDNVKRGDTVTITATLTPSEKDPKFAYGKRPTKATIHDDMPGGYDPCFEGGRARNCTAEYSH
jgi:hypothetical protein